MMDTSVCISQAHNLLVYVFGSPEVFLFMLVKFTSYSHIKIFYATYADENQSWDNEETVSQLTGPVCQFLKFISSTFKGRFLAINF